MKTLTSKDNAQIKNILKLQKSAKFRRQSGCFIAEGLRVCVDAVLSGAEIKALFITDEAIEKNADAYNTLSSHSDETYVLSSALFDYISDTQAPQGILCVVKQFHYDLKDLTRGESPLCVVLENLQDPGNLGTIFRTAEGAGVSGILLSRDSVDLYNPKVIRSTMGSVYRMPFYYTDNLHAVLRDWKEQGIALYAAHLKGNHTYDHEDYRKSSAFLIGNESQGLTEETASLANHYIRIPMSGQVESLNAAVAAAILMYEARRQKGT